jgi:predicted dehydrogenase
VAFIGASFTFQVRSETNIRLRADMAGGALMDVGCYCVNLMRFITGEEPVTVSALARFGERTLVDEYLVGIMQFPSGVLGHFDCGLRTFSNHSYEIRGSKGRILVEQGFVMTPGADMTIRHWREDVYQEIMVGRGPLSDYGGRIRRLAYQGHTCPVSDRRGCAIHRSRTGCWRPPG